MSKQTLSWGCALLLAVGMWGNHQLTAQEAAPSVTAARHYVSAAGRRIHATLDQPLKTPLNFEVEALDIVLAAIAEEYNLSIVFDRAALDEVAISPESEVSLNLRNISLRSAINIMLKEPGLEDLCHVVEDEVLLITTVEKANEVLRGLVYRVDDLLDTQTRQFNATVQHGDPDRLIDLIVSNVERDSWTKNRTGEGEIRFYPPGMLVISQTQRVHDQVDELLGQLRSVKQQILSGSSSAVAEMKPATQGFVIDIEMGDNPVAVQARLIEAIKGSVDWAASEKEERAGDVWIDVLPDRVLVHHLPTVLSQVGIVLSDMKILDQECHGGSGGIDCDPRSEPSKKAATPDLAE
ncbi:MAG: hypothetical protein ACR2NM_10530 [Bythopirellula sp.]